MGNRTSKKEREGFDEVPTYYVERSRNGSAFTYTWSRDLVQFRTTVYALSTDRNPHTESRVAVNLGMVGLETWKPHKLIVPLVVDGAVYKINCT
jgi:hypothetical protein